MAQPARGYRVCGRPQRTATVPMRSWGAGMIDVPEMTRSGLMQARALAFLIPEDGVDPKLIDEWRAKIICACALDVRFRKAFFAELHQVMAKIEALAAALRKPLGSG